MDNKNFTKNTKVSKQVLEGIYFNENMKKSIPTKDEIMIKVTITRIRY